MPRCSSGDGRGAARPRHRADAGHRTPPAPQRRPSTAASPRCAFRSQHAFRRGSEGFCSRKPSDAPLRSLAAPCPAEDPREAPGDGSSADMALPGRFCSTAQPCSALLAAHVKPNVSAPSHTGPPAWLCPTQPPQAALGKAGMVPLPNKTDRSQARQQRNPQLQLPEKKGRLSRLQDPSPHRFPKGEPLAPTQSPGTAGRTQGSRSIALRRGAPRAARHQPSPRASCQEHPVLHKTQPTLPVGSSSGTAEAEGDRQSCTSTPGGLTFPGGISRDSKTPTEVHGEGCFPQEGPAVALRPGGDHPMSGDGVTAMWKLRLANTKGLTHLLILP